ncbi:MAG: PKD domain-containing protein [Candidatus Bathyarchaeota archaeon]|nr:PKD domain-containing protein [Candidatus Bathyarchaeota archaeon]
MHKKVTFLSMRGILLLLLLLTIVFCLTVYISQSNAQPPNSYPVASFTYSPSRPQVNETVTFYANTSYDLDGYIVSYYWNFGDDSYFQYYYPTVSHVYQSPGRYTVTLTVYDNTGLNGTHTETVVIGEFLREPRPLYIVAVVGTGLTAITSLLTNFSELGQSFNSAVSRLPVPEQLKEFLKFYSEKLFETVDWVELEALRKMPFYTVNELATFGISALTVTIVYSFVETNGFPGFLDPAILAVVIPSTLLSVCLVFIMSEFFEAVCARAFGVYRQFKLWLFGLAAFLISGFLFLFPFASPSITRYRSGEISNKTKALIVLSKMLLLLTLLIPFTVLSMTGFHIIGDAGLLLTLMMVCYSLVPLKPLPGAAVFDYRKEVSLVVFSSAALLFLGHTFYFLPQLTYLIIGAVSALLVTIIIGQIAYTRKTENEEFPPPPPPPEYLPPPPPPP